MSKELTIPPQSSHDILQLMGIETWLLREGSSKITNNSPSEDIKASNRAEVVKEPELKGKAAKVWLDEYPTDIQGWALLDAILASIGLHRSEMTVLIGEAQRRYLAGCKLKLCFSSAPSFSAVPSEASHTFPSLDSLLASPRKKAAVWQQLQSFVSNECAWV